MRLYIYICLILITNTNNIFSNASSCYTTDIAITAHENFCLYISGYLIGCGASWTSTYYFRITEVMNGDAIVVDAYNSAGSGGIYGVIGDQVTNNENWKCRASLVNQTTWLQNSFDDTAWDNANTIITSSETRPNIPTNAYWIWTNSSLDSKVYCRYIYKCNF